MIPIHGVIPFLFGKMNRNGNCLGVLICPTDLAYLGITIHPMDILNNILEYLLPFLLGGGLSWILSFRLKRKQSSAKIVEEIIDDMTNRMMEMGKEMTGLIEENYQIRHSLMKRITELEGKLRLLKKKLEP